MSRGPADQAWGFSTLSVPHRQTPAGVPIPWARRLSPAGVRAAGASPVARRDARTSSPAHAARSAAHRSAVLDPGVVR